MRPLGPSLLPWRVKRITAVTMFAPRSVVKFIIAKLSETRSMARIYIKATDRVPPAHTAHGETFEAFPHSPQ